MGCVIRFLANEAFENRGYAHNSHQLGFSRVGGRFCKVALMRMIFVETRCFASHARASLETETRSIASLQ